MNGLIHSYSAANVFFVYGPPTFNKGKYK